MRRPTQIECLYLDFDVFFASVEQTVHPALRGRPIGVVPFLETERTCVIACSREATLLYFAIRALRTTSWQCRLSAFSSRPHSGLRPAAATTLPHLS